jgi:hypothetical protein
MLKLLSGSIRVMLTGIQPIKMHSLYMKSGELPELKLISWTATISRWSTGTMI